MNPPRAAALAAVPLPTELQAPEIGLVLAALIGLTGFFATVRHSLLRAVPDRVLERIGSERRRALVARLLERSDSLASSAAALKLTADLVIVLCVLALVDVARGTTEGGATTLGETGYAWTSMGLALAITVPLVLVVGDIVAALIARGFGEVLLGRLLPTFHLVQLPVWALVVALEAVRRAAGRVVGLSDRSESERRILAGFRQVIEESPDIRELDETEREFIENVMEFRDVDAAEVMTPRTEIVAVEASLGMDEAARCIAESGHSRIPVYRENLDTIVGFFTARDLLKRRAAEATKLEEVVRPAYFIPETKHMSELLKEFRAQRLKLAVVLDEYGGTAGIVTMGDILGELVGEIPDEFDADEPAPIRMVAPNLHEVDASMRVSEVNEELELDLPEEQDFETLAGFVLSELGRFPKRGESFAWGRSEFTVSDANDRRVLEVRIRSLEAKSA